MFIDLTLQLHADGPFWRPNFKIGKQIIIFHHNGYVEIKIFRKPINDFISDENDSSGEGK